MKGLPHIVYSALLAGVSSFVVLYVVLALGLVFALSWRPDNLDAQRVEQGFRVLGLVALLFPGYLAARLAGALGLLHGLLTGLCVALLGSLFLLYTFSWEGSHQQAVVVGIARTVVVAVVFSALGGVLGEWRNRRNRV